LNRVRVGRRGWTRVGPGGPGVDGASAAVELLLVTPLILGVIAVIVFGGRVWVARQAVASSAAEAARTASIARTAAQARAGAAAGAAQTLADQDVHCLTQTVQVDLTGFTAPVGTPASVSATVTCVVDLADLAVPGIPGRQTVTATMTSPLDTYRARSTR